MALFSLNRDDLNFLLTQVTIGTDYSQLANALDPSGLREVSGSNNNLVGSTVGTPGPFVAGPYTTIGQADQAFLRLSQTSYNPTGPDAAYGTPGNGAAGNVTDATARLVSNLVATSFTSGPNANPAAIEAVTDFYGSLPPVSDPAAFIPNAGVLGGGRYNAWFTAFGQFFDHGLDFVQKGASGTITIPIMPGDPLYVDPLGPDYVPGVSNIMRVSRANLANPDSDFVSGDGTGALNPGVTPIYKNNTGLLIDQSQTYGSHESMNAFLREYDATGTPTGRLVTGSGDANGDLVTDGLATWADVKANALKIGIVLTDDDLFNAPRLRVDATGKLQFTPDPADSWSATGVFAGPQDPNDPFMRDEFGNVLRTNQAFLIDINPAADPSFMFDGPGYDSALLDAHYITGDGRANENYLLTAVHHVFHEEHNFQVANIKAGILATGDAAFIAQWQTSPGQWDGEKLFQAARLITESEYNHIAIDQYVGVLYGALPEFVSYSSDINMGVSLEFSQAVFRLGHSMLTQTFKVANPDGSFTDVPLLEAFLNPTQFAALGPAAITAGLVRVYGNEVDEFVTPALQQTLLGQPLDLATINIARGRDVGLPTHNELRQQIYDGLLKYTNNSSNSSALAPYTSWQDYGDHLKHPGTLVNMIAAYARDVGDVWGIEDARAAYLAGTGTLDAIRAAAQAVVDAYADAGNPDHAAAVEFIQGTPTYNTGTGQWEFLGGDQGFWDVDLWIGGLAERPLFDGPLGTTFSYILLDFAQRQQDGDRFYYLYRTPMGTHLGDAIIASHFSEMVMRATGLEHLNGDVFITPDAIFDLGKNPDGSDAGTNDFFDSATHTITYADLTSGLASGGHLIIAGNGGNDYMLGGLGDDTIYGDAGNDFIQGSQGNDHLYGGDGDDVILDDENDDFIRGGAGNDKIYAGGGALDTVFGDDGDDEIHGGDGIDELLGGDGDDLIFGDGDTDVVFGENGNDYLEGGDSVDEMQGQGGNDWLRGGVGDDHLMGGDGNDLLEGGIGPTANDGDRMIGQGTIDFGPAAPADLGFDIASYEDVDIAVTANLHTSNENGTGGLLDSYAGIDGLVGSRFNDNLTAAGPDTTSTNGFDNLLVGGAGNDVLIGLGGDDRIFGDAVVVKNDLSVYLGPASAYTTIANWKGTGESRPDFGTGGGLGHFLGDNGPAGLADTAVFSGDFGNYDITANPDGSFLIVDTRGIDSTAVGDTVMDVELFQFADGTRTASQLFNQAPTDIQWNGIQPGNSDLPAAGAVIANLSTVDPDSTSWTYSLQPGSSAGFAVSAAGIVTRTGSAMATNTTYTLVVRSLDDGGKSLNETFNIRTGNNNNNNLTAFSTANDDIIYGDDDDDTLNGGNGNDTLFGQDEDDTLNGGAGNDVLNGGTGDSDTASYAGAAGAVIVSLAIAGQQNTLGAGSDTLVSIENLTGSSFGDTLTGDANANVLTGSAGNDALNGGGGTDTAAFAGPRANYSFALSGANVVVTDTSAGSPDGTDTLNNIETFQFADQSLTLRAGTDAANTITVNGGPDLLLGFGGNDTLNSGGGDDVLIGGAGNDGLNGGAGTDTAVFSGPVASFSFSLSGASVVVTDTRPGSPDGVDTLSNIEVVQFGSQTLDLNFGSNSGNTLSTGGGTDLLLGFGGNDELDGGAGADVLVGGAGTDDFNFDDGDTGVGAGNRDVILDFLGGGGDEDIDLSAIDANTGVGGGGGAGQTFNFIGTAAFSAAGQVRYSQVDTDGVGGADSTLIEGNVNAGLSADLEILLKGFTSTLVANDFIL